jgi:hypothetical protein
MGKILTSNFDIIPVGDNVKINVLGFRDNKFSCDIKRNLSNDQAYEKNLLNFPSLTLRALAIRLCHSCALWCQ